MAVGMESGSMMCAAGAVGSSKGNGSVEEFMGMLDNEVFWVCMWRVSARVVMTVLGMCR